jgi:asparagine synthase (glutamine-hydrolysing)
MCGICGIYGSEDRSAIQKMLRVMKHRGPDGEGIYTDRNISLGHTRLSIIDLSENGRQPLSNEDGDIWISVNGEIYNFPELRVLLQSRGHRFRSRSDSEVIVHAYEEFGLDFIRHLRGMFALAVYDAKKERLILARDPIGKKPLYYSSQGNLLIFASEIKALLQIPGSREIEYAALWSYLAFQYTLGDLTLFQGIKKVLPGTMIVYENKTLSMRRYWDIHENIQEVTEHSAACHLRQLLEDAVRVRMVSDVPVGAFLSGGIDSSAVVALARSHMSEPFHTFSMGFETHSELDYAEIVSSHLDTVHHEIVMTGKNVNNELKKIAWLYDEPLGDAAIINNYFLSKEAKKYVTVVLAGEGGDEVFAGYPHYQINTMVLRLTRPEFYRRIMQFILHHIPSRYGCYDASGYTRYLRYANAFHDTTIERIHLNTTRQMTDDEIHELTTLPPTYGNESAVFVPGIKHPLNRMLATDCRNLLPEKYLMKADKGTMANSVEERAPLLDPLIIDYAFTLPPSLKLCGMQEKYLLRKAVEDLLPKAITRRRKKGFGTTVGHWMENDLRDYVIQTIHDGPLLSSILKKDLRCQNENAVKMGIHKSPFKIWTLFALELWYDTYFLNENRDLDIS